MATLLENVDIYGNKRGRLVFCCLKLKEPFRYAVTADSDMVVVKGKDGGASYALTGKRPVHKNMEILETLVPKAYVKVFHNSALYAIGYKFSFDYSQKKSDRYFKVLYRIAKVMLDRKRKVDLDQFCELCRSCFIFKRNRSNGDGGWSCWYKMIVTLMDTYWSEFAYDYFNMGVARRMHAIHRRTQLLPYGGVPDESICCEVLLNPRDKLGVMYIPFAYVSPMIVSYDAFHNGNNAMRDINFVQCTHWLPLFLDKDHWLAFSMSYYMKDAKFYYSQVTKLLEHFRTENLKSEKHEFLSRDLEQVAKLLRL